MTGMTRGLADPERLIVRGFQEGKKSWLYIWPPRGPKMKLTHEVLEGLGDRLVSRDVVLAKILSERAIKQREKALAHATRYIHPEFRGRTYSKLKTRQTFQKLKSGVSLPTQTTFGPPVLAGLEKALTSQARKKLPSSAFALAGRRYPVHDCSHARNALSRASMSYHRGALSKRERDIVVRKARAAVRRLCH
jgi:hypothetical protein